MRRRRRTISVWDAETLRLRGADRRDIRRSTPAAWRSHRTVGFLLSGGTGRCCELWEVATGKELNRRRRAHRHRFKQRGVYHRRPPRPSPEAGTATTAYGCGTWKPARSCADSRAHGRRRRGGPLGRTACRLLSGSTDKAHAPVGPGDGEGATLLPGQRTESAACLFSRAAGLARPAVGRRTRPCDLWDVETGQERYRLTGHSCGHNGVHGWPFSPGRAAGAVRPLATGRPAVGRGGRAASCTASSRCRGRDSSVAFAADGRRAPLSLRLATGCVRLLGPGGPQSNCFLPEGFTPEPCQLLRVAFSPDGRQVLSRRHPTTWCGYGMWQAVGSAPLARDPPDLGRGHFRPTAGGVLGAGQGGGNMALWDAENGQELRRFVGSDGLWDAAMSRDGRRILTGGNDGTIRLWDCESGRDLSCFRGHTARCFPWPWPPTAAQPSPAVAQDGTVRLWDLDTGRERRLLQAARQAVVYGVAFSPDGRYVAAGDNDGFVRFWDVSGTEPKWQPLPKWHTGAVRGVAVCPGRPDAGFRRRRWPDHRLGRCDRRRGREWQLPGGVEGVAFAADGRHLAAANGNGTVYILRVKSGQ